MNFPYSSIISLDPGSGEYLLIRRPEIPVAIVGPSGAATFVGLVDTGSDNTIFPKSVADYLGISTGPSSGPAALVFGGQHVQLLTGEAILKLEADGLAISWKSLICFFESPSSEEETIILGHAGFLDYFTAVFDGLAGKLTLIPNGDMPS